MHFTKQFFSILSLSITLLLTLSSLVFTSSAQAHSRGESYSKWLINEKGADFTYTLALKDISKLSDYFQGSEPGWKERVTQHIREHTHLSDNNLPCKLTDKFHHQSASGFLQLTGQFLCHGTEKLSIEIYSIFNIDSRHMHISRVNFINGDISEKVFLARDREWKLYQSENSEGKSIQGSTFISYLIIGIEHIATGWDHLAFLAAICLLLLLMQASSKIFLIIISGFTLGHSASLVFTVLGYLNPNALVVESLIALSIALLAIETIAYQHKSFFMLSIAASLSILFYLLSSQFIFISAIPWPTLLGLCLFVVCYFNLSAQASNTTPQLLLTLLFGLVHGFCFAGSLQDIGLPQDRLILALVSFNVGVELGQLIIVGVALSLITQINKHLPRIKTNIMIELSAASLCGLGVFWFIQRSLL